MCEWTLRQRGWERERERKRQRENGRERERLFEAGPTVENAKKYEQKTGTKTAKSPFHSFFFVIAKKIQGRYSQHFVFFVTYKWAQS